MNDLQRLQQARDIIISAIAQTMVIYGVTPSIGRIYGVLYFAEAPLTLDEIKDQVSMSKASVSNGMRALLETEMVTKVWKKGDNKDHYIAEKDFFLNFISFFTKKLRQERNLIAKATEQSRPAIEEIARNSSNPEVAEAAKRDLENLENSEMYLLWTMNLANALESGEIYQYFPKKSQSKGD